MARRSLDEGTDTYLRVRPTMNSVPPPPPSSFAYQEAEPEPQRHLAIDYYRTVLRHKYLVLTLAGIGMVIALLMHLTTQPIYQTRTSLEIQSLNGEFTELRSANPMASDAPNDTNLQTEVKLLQSDTLNERVQQRLLLEPHPEVIQQNDLLSRLKRAFHLGSPRTISFDSLLEETSKQTKIKPLGVTRLVEVTCSSWDASFAAKFCNTLTTEFQDQELENRGSEAKRTSDWLMHQAADVRQKAEESQRQLYAATGGNGLMLSQQTDTVGEDRLRQIQGELVKAQADRMLKEAQTSVARSSAADATPSVVDDPGYAASRAKLAELQREVAAIVPPLTEANPKVIHLRSQIKAVQESMGSQQNVSLSRLQNEYAAAKHRENLLALTYQTEEHAVSSDLEKGSQVSLLRREVESEQQLYQTLLQRAKEAGFASAMHASTIRVVDAARAPRFAAFPNHTTTAIVGMLLGFLIGLLIAFLKDRNTAVFRMPGESERYLQVNEIGVIPSPSVNLKETHPSPRELEAPSVLALTASVEHTALASAGWDDQFSLVAEAYRNATLSIMKRGTRKTCPVYVVSSPSASEGKTTVTTNLGVALSKSKLRVVLIDGDLRKPSLHHTLSVSNHVGLRDVLRGDVNPATSSVNRLIQATNFPNLYVIPAGVGREEPVSLLHSVVLGDLIDRLTVDFDVILIDSPPVLHMADARILANHADAAILVLRSGVTTRDLAAAARDLFDHDRIRIMGTLLNDFNPGKQGHGSYYKSYYAYQAHAVADEPTGARS